MRKITESNMLAIKLLEIGCSGKCFEEKRLNYGLNDRKEADTFRWETRTLQAEAGANAEVRRGSPAWKVARAYLRGRHGGSIMGDVYESDEFGEAVWARHVGAVG